MATLMVIINRGIDYAAVVPQLHMQVESQNKMTAGRKKRVFFPSAFSSVFVFLHEDEQKFFIRLPVSMETWSGWTAKLVVMSKHPALLASRPPDYYL
ncbi:uncharacterized protein CIMG_12747 [Coccidioides immitis RS]|uniref:Uncharacterized protein n=1 Tax=Coccidioides immitis (strain RS) TaxID=246410 RepID=A0A0D8JSL7_COCIM|nr:uncharacterized protein CIMG_12747 [Coccidioides immitis RS]KJF60104.1 hypothetical protein CIMG_12747 [Coccidioides immitis RS]